MKHMWRVDDSKTFLSPAENLKPCMCHLGRSHYVLSILYPMISSVTPWFFGGYLWRIRSQLEKISTVTPCCLQESTSGRNETSRSGRYLRRASPPLHPGDPEKPSETSLVKSWKGLQNPYWIKNIIFIYNIWYIKCPYTHRTCHHICRKLPLWSLMQFRLNQQICLQGRRVKTDSSTSVNFSALQLILFKGDMFGFHVRFSEVHNKFITHHNSSLEN